MERVLARCHDNGILLEYQNSPGEYELLPPKGYTFRNGVTRLFLDFNSMTYGQAMVRIELWRIEGEQKG